MLTLMLNSFEERSPVDHDQHITFLGASEQVSVNSDSMGFTAKIVGYLIFVPVICLFGIIGNIVNIIVLHKGPFKGAAYVYLKGLAVYDMLSLIFILPICIIRCPTCSVSGPAWLFYEAYIYIPIGDIFLKASIVTTLVFTIERCIIICYNSKFHFETKKTKTAVKVVSLIGIACSLENLPTFWMYTISDSTIKPTDFAGSVSFNVYGWIDAVFFQLIPFLILFVFNIILIVYLRSHRKLQQRIQFQSPTLTIEQKFNLEQTRMIFLLIGIIVLFLVTMVPSSVMQLIGYTITFRSDVYTKFQVTTTVLIALNFSCNFLLYCAINKRFWRTLKRLMCCCCFNRVEPEVDSALTAHVRTVRGTLRQTSNSSSRISAHTRHVAVAGPSGTGSRFGGNNSVFDYKNAVYQCDNSMFECRNSEVDNKNSVAEQSSTIVEHTFSEDDQNDSVIYHKKVPSTGE